MSETASAATVGTPDVSLRYPGGELPLRVVPATEGADGLDTGKLLSTTGQVALDIGFVNTAACTSAITYIDGDAGILRYRGYPIDQLAENASFLEVSYLLIYGELPTAQQLSDFVERKLYPNVDFYTGLIYRAMGFPTKMFTVLFALGRLPGWIAQWREMMADPSTKIGRPRQVYTGETERQYVEIADR